MAQAAHFIEPHSTFPCSEKKLHFPPHTIELCNIMSGEDVAREGGQVIAVFVFVGDANNTGCDLSTPLCDLHIEVKHGLVMDVAELAGLVEA
jgi:hypothetical protein